MQTVNKQIFCIFNLKLYLLKNARNVGTNARYLRVPMGADVHLSKRADVSDADDVHREITIEVDDVDGSWSQLEDEDEGCEKRAHELL